MTSAASAFLLDAALDALNHAATTSALQGGQRSLLYAPNAPATAASSSSRYGRGRVAGHCVLGVGQTLYWPGRLFQVVVPIAVQSCCRVARGLP
jgi:hypothetical protein